VIDDSWWAALGARVLPPVQVQIIEALRCIDQPLSAAELFVVLDKQPEWQRFCHHLRRLIHLRVIALIQAPSVSDPPEISYQLVAPAQ